MLFLFLAFATLGWTSFGFGQTPQQTAPPGAEHKGLEQPGAALAGSIRGIVVDQSGAVVGGARVRLVREDQSGKQGMVTGGDGEFSFDNVEPGPFQLTIMAAGFAMQTFSGTLHSGEIDAVGQIALNVAEDRTEVQVGLTRSEVAELAEEQIKAEEKQRVLAVIPNFYVSYIPNAAPLDVKQKFELAWKTVIDPFTLVVVAGAAGVEQAQNHFAEYGQGAQGYGQRFGAGYADTVTGTFIGGAILPSLLKQDPRYFYKGSGNKAYRLLYAIGNAVICKGDNGRWQPNYSNILGSLAAGGISNLYYPKQDRNGVGLTFANAAIGIGATAIGNVFQEFVIRKLTPKTPKQNPSKP